MRLNREELVVGYAFGLLFLPKLGWWVILVSCLTSLLWALGGSYMKVYRRVGCAVIPTVACAYLTHSLTPLLSAPLIFTVLCIGYGIPSTQPEDSGSWLGKVAFNLTHDMEAAHWITRSIIAILLLLSTIPIYLN